MAGFAKIDLAQIVLFHQLHQPANPFDFKDAIGRSFGFSHRGFPRLSRFRGRLSRRSFRGSAFGRSVGGHSFEAYSSDLRETSDELGLSDSLIYKAIFQLFRHTRQHFAAGAGNEHIILDSHTTPAGK